MTSEQLQELLSKSLRAKTALAGSILYRLTWKHRVTPSGRAICALRASAARTSVSDFILSGWPTPTTRDFRDVGNLESSRFRKDGKERKDTVPRIAWLTLNKDSPARLCSDGTLLTGSSAGMGSGGRLDPAHSRWIMRLPPEWDVCAPTETLSMLKRRRDSAKP